MVTLVFTYGQSAKFEFPEDALSSAKQLLPAKHSDDALLYALLKQAPSAHLRLTCPKGQAKDTWLQQVRHLHCSRYRDSPFRH